MTCVSYQTFQTTKMFFLQYLQNKSHYHYGGLRWSSCIHHIIHKIINCFMYFRRTKHKRRLSILKVKRHFALTFNLILTPNIIVTTPYTIMHNNTKTKTYFTGKSSTFSLNQRQFALLTETLQCISECIFFFLLNNVHIYGWGYMPDICIYKYDLYGTVVTVVVYRIYMYTIFV